MPQLKRKIIEVTLPDYGDKNDPAIVKLYNKLTVGEIDEDDRDTNKTTVERICKVLEKLIVSWNLNDEKGITLPITFEEIRKLSMDDLHALNDALNVTAPALTPQKKNS